MSRRKIAPGATGVMLPILAQDTRSTVGAGLPGLAAGTAGLTAKYRRAGQSAWTTISLSPGTIGVWASGSWTPDAAAPPGVYELGLPNAAVAAGVPWVLVAIAAPDLLEVVAELELDHVDAVAVADACAVAIDENPPAAAELSPSAIGAIASALQDAALPHNPLAKVPGDLEVLVPDDYTAGSTQPLAFPVEGFPPCPSGSVSLTVYGAGGFTRPCTTADLGSGKQQVTVGDIATSVLAGLPRVDGVPFRCWCNYQPTGGSRTLREGMLWLRRIPR